MIPFDPTHPHTPIRRLIKVIPVTHVAQRLDHSQGDYFAERRGYNDRRKQPFRHRGRYEMRKGRERRTLGHIDTEA
ncbi:hypothetical protein [Marinagarivorans algicola]|uniref:hypothetical protein n=1 Tax=Marinagarivorans algicola TaxID=1513270 RepID=UPI0006B9D3CB|nr:hypothetical protein [Marinagarivorans algicola]